MTSQVSAEKIIYTESESDKMLLRCLCICLIEILEFIPNCELNDRLPSGVSSLHLFIYTETHMKYKLDLRFLTSD